MREEINNGEKKKTVEWNNETKSWFFKIINKMDQPQPDLSTRKEKRP